MTESTKTRNKNYSSGSAAGGGAVYGLGLIGALIYYLPQAHSFWQVILSILKSIVWPAIMVYKLFGLLHA